MRGVGPLGRLGRRLLGSEYFVLCLSLAYFAVLWAVKPAAASPANLADLSSNVWPLLVLVIGQMFVLVAGGIDLSQMSVMAMASVVGSMIMTTKLDPVVFDRNPLWGTILTADGGLLSGSAWAIPVAIAAMLLVGALVGLFNGFAVAKLKMPPFMVTLVTMFFFSGLAIYATRSENIGNLPRAFTDIGQSAAVYVTVGRARIAVVPYSFLLAAPLAAAAHLILSRTLWGHWLYAVGMNVQAARVSGVPVERVQMLAYVLSGLCAAVGSILYSARLGGGRPTLGETMLLDVIAAAVIGGVSLFGGKGKVTWALLGVVFLALLTKSLNQMNVSFYMVNIIKGAVILVAASLDVLRARWAAAVQMEGR